MKHDKNIDPENQADHETGLEIIRVLKLRRKRDNGRIDTTHGDKNPCGLTRTLHAILDPEHERRAAEHADMLAALQTVLACLENLREVQMWDKMEDDAIDEAFDALNISRAAITKATQP